MRYFFELIDGGVNLPDMLGTELADDTVAHNEAMHRAEHHSQVQRHQGHSGHRSVRVRDERGRVVADVPIE